MNPSRSPVPLIAGALALACYLACGTGGEILVAPDAGVSGISGVVWKGPVAGATVTAYALTPTLQRGRAIASAVSDETGGFLLPDLHYIGDLVLVANAGAYVDEATGESVQLDGELSAVVLDYETTEALSNVSINPITHLETVLARVYVETRAESVPDALARAREHLVDHFLRVDWAQTTPADVLAPRGAQLDSSAKAALVLAAISWHAKTISEAAGLSGTSRVTAMTLVEAYAEDLEADGYFDGQGRNGSIILPEGGSVSPTGPTAYRMGDQTVRAHLALAMQRFVSSERNATAIALGDVEALVNSMSRNPNPVIFRTAGSELDVEPPEVTWAVSFAPTLATTSGPVGELKLVRGVVTVTATASDVSDLSSLAVTVNGSPLLAAPQGNSPSLYVGSWNTTLGADGPLTFTAEAVDAASTPNTGTSTFTVNVDNTAPAITVTSPAAGGFYSLSAPVLADATDAHGIVKDGFTSSGLAGFGDTDNSDGRVVGTWDIAAAAAAEGAVQASFVACDVVGNCSTQPRSFYVDRTPPVLEVLQLPPPYTAVASAYVRLAAADVGAGVQSVHLSANGGSPVAAAEESPGVYGATVPLTIGPNTIAAWAVDRTLTANNSGVAAAVPHRLTLQSLFDNAPPVPTNVTNGGSYRSEASMSFQESSPGVPVMPVAYTNLGALAPLSFGSVIHKVSTRLGWSGITPSASELMGPNASNTPFLLFEGYVDGDSEAPFTAVAYSVSCAACGGSGGPATGNLLPAGDGGDMRYLRWVLPLNAATVPALGRSQVSPVQLDITVRITDAAGREGTVSGSVTVHIVAPPVAWSEETNYPTALDPQSLYGYRLTNDTYDNLFDPSNANFPSGAPARIARYVIRNPFPAPVVVQLAQLDSGAWTLSEDWDDDVYDPPNPAADSPYSMDGHTFPTRVKWAHPESNWVCGGTALEDPCPSGNNNFEDNVEAVHTLGSSTKYSCLGPTEAPPPKTTGAINVGGSGWDTRAYVNPSQNGNEQQLTQEHLIGGQRAWRVPAASGSTPGSVVVYVVVPRTRASAPPLLTANLPGRTDGDIRYHYRDYWEEIAQEVLCHDSIEDQYHYIQTYERRYWYRKLATASFSLSSSLRLRTNGTYDAGGGNFSLLGVPRDLVDDSFAATLDFNTAL